MKDNFESGYAVPLFSFLPGSDVISDEFRKRTVGQIALAAHFFGIDGIDLDTVEKLIHTKAEVWVCSSA